MTTSFIAIEGKRVNLGAVTQYELLGNNIVFYGGPIFDASKGEIDACPVLDKWEFATPKAAKVAMQIIDDLYVSKTLSKT